MLRVNCQHAASCASTLCDCGCGLRHRRFITQLPSFSSSSDGGMITAAIGAVTLGAHGTRRAQGTTSEIQPWAFAPNPVAAGGECALVKSSVSPTDDKKQVRVGWLNWTVQQQE